MAFGHQRRTWPRPSKRFRRETVWRGPCPGLPSFLLDRVLRCRMDKSEWISEFQTEAFGAVPRSWCKPRKLCCDNLFRPWVRTSLKRCGWWKSYEPAADSLGRLPSSPLPPCRAPEPLTRWHLEPVRREWWEQQVTAIDTFARSCQT